MEEIKVGEFVYICNTASLNITESESYTFFVSNYPTNKLCGMNTKLLDSKLLGFVHSKSGITFCIKYKDGYFYTLKSWIKNYK